MAVDVVEGREVPSFLVVEPLGVADPPRQVGAFTVAGVLGEEDRTETNPDIKISYWYT